MVRVEEVRDFAVQQSAAFDYITDPHDMIRLRLRLRMRLLGRAVDMHMTLDTSPVSPLHAPGEPGQDRSGNGAG